MKWWANKIIQERIIDKSSIDVYDTLQEYVMQSDKIKIAGRRRGNVMIIEPIQKETDVFVNKNSAFYNNRVPKNLLDSNKVYKQSIFPYYKNKIQVQSINNHQSLIVSTISERGFVNTNSFLIFPLALSFWGICIGDYQFLFSCLLIPVFLVVRYLLLDSIFRNAKTHFNELIDSITK